MANVAVSRRWKGVPLNGCSACGEDFTSLELIDAHHVGDHEVDFPEYDHGRRCLEAEEMTGRGWVQNIKGRWLNPARANRARRTFEKAA